MSCLPVLMGAAVGLALGLTGGGGAILAVPMLVYGLSLGAHEAVAISLATVGAISAGGFLLRMRHHEAEPLAGLIFGLAAMSTAPAGVWLGGHTPEQVLLAAFAALLLVVALVLWERARRRPLASVSPAYARRRGLQVAAGAGTGLLSGFFGVGGGFLIVPALVLSTGMPIHRAAGTSLMVIAMTSAAGFAQALLQPTPVDWPLTMLFIAGGAGGMQLGAWWSRRLSPLILQRVFAAGLIVVSAFMWYQILNS